VELEQTWAVVWHAKGALHVMRLRELLEVNALHFEKEEPGYMPLALASGLDVAQEKKRGFGRMKRSAGENNSMRVSE
jgi:hypothetical protein